MSIAAERIYIRSGQPFEARVQQKEKSKLRGPHPGNTFMTMKNTIYNTKSINVKLGAASGALRDEMSGATDETDSSNTSFK